MATVTTKRARSAVTNGNAASVGTSRWLALGAVAGPMLFTLAWSVLGFLSPGYTLFGVHIAPYSAISQPVSGLGLGPTAPFMNAAFVLSGLLLLAGVVDIFQGIEGMGKVARRTSIALLALLPLGAITDGVFTLEAGFVHYVGFLAGFGGAIIGFPVTGLLLRRVPGWRRLGNWLLLACPLTLALVAFFFMTFTPTVGGARTGVAGLTERLLITEAMAWYAIMGWRAFRRSQRAAIWNR